MTPPSREGLLERLKYFSGWSVRMEGMSPSSELAWDAIEEIERLRNTLSPVSPGAPPQGKSVGAAGK